MGLNIDRKVDGKSAESRAPRAAYTPLSKLGEANVNALQRVYPNGMISSWTTVDWFELNSYVVTLTLYPEHLMTSR